MMIRKQRFVCSQNGPIFLLITFLLIARFENFVYIFFKIFQNVGVAPCWEAAQEAQQYTYQILVF